MPKQLRLPLALVVVLGLLTGLAYWDDWQTKKDEGAKKAKSQLFTMKPEEVTAVEYVRHDHDHKINLELKATRLTPNKWSVDAPIETKGDTFTIDNMLRQILEYQSEETINIVPERMAEFGLDNPEIRVVLHAGEKSIAIRIGNKAPVGMSLYSMIEGTNQVIVGPQYLGTSVVKTLHDFRNKALLDVTAEDVTKITVKRASGDYVLAKSDKGQWQLEGGSLALDQVAVAEYISDVRGQNVQTFIDAPTPLDQAIFKAPKPEEKVAVTILDKNGVEKSFVAVARGEDVWVTFDPAVQIFRLSKEAFGKLNRDMGFFYDKILAEVNPTDVMEVTVSGRKMAKEAGNWHVDGSKEARSDVNDLVSNMANTLAMLKAEQVRLLDAKTTVPKENPVYTVEMGMRDPKGMMSTVTYTFWKNSADPQTFFATSSQKATLLFWVPRVVLQQIEDVLAKLPKRAAAAADKPAKG